MLVAWRGAIFSGEDLGGFVSVGIPGMCRGVGTMWRVLLVLCGL